MDISILQAEVKSVARKNTQVTFIKKNVNRARKKLLSVLVFTKAGIMEALSMTISVAILFGLLISFSFINLSAQRYIPCNAPQTTNVHEAPCHSPPSSMVIIR